MKNILIAAVCLMISSYSRVTYADAALTGPDRKIIEISVENIAAQKTHLVKDKNDIEKIQKLFVKNIWIKNTFRLTPKYKIILKLNGNREAVYWLGYVSALDTSFGGKYNSGYWMAPSNNAVIDDSKIQILATSVEMFLVLKLIDDRASGK